MTSIRTQLKRLSRQLYPSGRAFAIVPNGDKEKLVDGLNESYLRAYNDAISVFNSALPDNPNFTMQDATDWYIRLGLIQSSGVSLADMKTAILRKMNHPGNIPARQNYLYIQGQLQAAGFNVYVYENVFPDGMGGFITKSPTVFSALPYPRKYIQHSTFIQHGDVKHGFTYTNKVVNHVEESLDDAFTLGPDLRATFFIGGPTAGSQAIIPANRKAEFRQLVLHLKPTQMIAFLLITFY